MTVDDLIAQLQRFRGDLEVLVDDPNSWPAPPTLIGKPRTGKGPCVMVYSIEPSYVEIPPEMLRSPPAFDYPSMIVRYMDAVSRAEGVTFVEGFRGTEAEMAEMLRLEALPPETLSALLRAVEIDGVEGVVAMLETGLPPETTTPPDESEGAV